MLEIRFMLYTDEAAKNENDPEMFYML